MTESDLVASWRRALVKTSAGLQLTDASHPLQIFVGKTDSGAPRAVIRSNVKPAMPVLAALVVVDRYEDQSCKWNLSLTLQDPKFTEVFLRLIDDVHARSAVASGESEAMDRVNTIFVEWRRLLKPRSAGLLSMEELRGLVGELWLVLEVFAAERGMGAALEGWLGPLGLPQDFWYPEDGYHEAKSIGPATTVVSIASESQLDAEGLQLLVLLVGNADDQAPSAVNLRLLADRVLARLSQLGVGPELLSDRLEHLGVTLDETFYQQTWFVVSHLTCYGVGADFPAIRARDLAPGVSAVRYQLELAAIQKFKISSVDLG
jgi:hypothetical protein